MNTLMTYAAATVILIIINAAVFLVETAAGGSRNIDTALRFGAMSADKVEEGQYYRLFTAMFVHFGFIHLLCNMYALYSVGPVVEAVFGTVGFLIIYLFSGLCGNLLTYQLSRRKNRYTVEAGASGAVFGLFGALLVMGLMPQFSGFISIRSVLFVLLINLAYGIGNKSISMSAHIGGFLGGLVSTFILGLLFL